MRKCAASAAAGRSDAPSRCADRARARRASQGTDFLFFQSPAPATGVQDDLASFFSAENFQDMEITPAQIGVTVVGAGTAVALASLLLA